MEYLELTQHYGGIFLFFGIGMFVGALIMFRIQHGTEEALAKELDKFRELYFNEIDKKNKL